MLDFMRAGGYATWVVLLLGLIALVAAATFLWRPNDKKIGFVRAMSAATVFASVGGVLSGIAAVMYHVPANPEWAESPKIHLIIMEGLGESMSSGILGFSILMVVWLMMAFGFRRRSPNP
jgi:hypothetical protein